MSNGRGFGAPQVGGGGGTRPPPSRSSGTLQLPPTGYHAHADADSHSQRSSYYSEANDEDEEDVVSDLDDPMVEEPIVVVTHPRPRARHLGSRGRSVGGSAGGGGDAGVEITV